MAEVAAYIFTCVIVCLVRRARSNRDINAPRHERVCLVELRACPILAVKTTSCTVPHAGSVSEEIYGSCYRAEGELNAPIIAVWAKITTSIMGVGAWGDCDSRK